MARSKSRPGTDAARKPALRRMDWQDVGREVWTKYIAGRDEFRSFLDANRQAEEKRFAARQEMAVAVAGNPRRFALWLLRSRIKLTREIREMLADLLEENIFAASKPIKSSDRCRHKRRSSARLYGFIAVDLYRDWKDANRRNCINDWGHRDEMKDEVCRLLIESAHSEKAKAPTFEQLRVLIDRPAMRRKYLDDSEKAKFIEQLRDRVVYRHIYRHFLRRQLA